MKLLAKNWFQIHLIALIFQKFPVEACPQTLLEGTQGIIFFFIIAFSGPPSNFLLCYAHVALQRVEAEQLEKTWAHCTEKVAELVERVTSKHKVVGSNPGSETLFFKTFMHGFFLNVSFASLLLGITSTLWDRTWTKLTAHHLGTQTCMLITGWSLLLLVLYNALKALA